MSNETAGWLNTFILAGNTANRNMPWWHQSRLQNGEPTTYPGAIPVADVRRRLLSWKLTEATVTATVDTPEVIDEHGVTPAQQLSIVDPTRKAILRPPGALGSEDPGAILGVFKSGYMVHQYDEWLIDRVAGLISAADGELIIENAGLLQGGGVAFVQIALPQACQAAGLSIVPFLTAYTSANGFYATGYIAGGRLVVCDNTLQAAMLDRDARQAKLRHTSGSIGRIESIHDALGILAREAATLTETMNRLSDIRVSDAQWAGIVADLVPAAAPGEIGHNAQAWGVASTKRESLTGLYCTDPRVGELRGTAAGVLQAVNTHNLHHRRVNGGDRAGRNVRHVIAGDVAKADKLTLMSMERVLGAQLLAV
jgi:phage/plasmid-like protein (TIGR03299 family)